jgi:CRP-like cAMP-binding protein
MTVTKMIKGHDLFRSFDFDDIAKLSDFTRKLQFDKGGIIYRSGQEGSHFFVVLDGRVNLKLSSDDNESNLVVGRMEKGDIFGMSPLLGFNRFTTSAVCATKCQILSVEIESFKALLDGNQQVHLNVMSIIARAYFSRYIDTLKRSQNALSGLAKKATA